MWYQGLCWCCKILNIINVNTKELLLLLVSKELIAWPGGRFSIVLDVLSYDPASLEGVRSVYRVYQLLWHLAGGSAAMPLSHLPNFKVIRAFWHPISWLQNLMKYYDKTSYCDIESAPVFRSLGLIEPMSCSCSIGNVLHKSLRWLWMSHTIFYRYWTCKLTMAFFGQYKWYNLRHMYTISWFEDPSCIVPIL